VSAMDAYPKTQTLLFYSNNDAWALELAFDAQRIGGVQFGAGRGRGAHHARHLGLRRLRRWSVVRCLAMNSRTLAGEHLRNAATMNPLPARAARIAALPRRQNWHASIRGAGHPATFPPATNNASPLRRTSAARQQECICAPVSRPPAMRELYALFCPRTRNSTAIHVTCGDPPSVPSQLRDGRSE